MSLLFNIQNNNINNSANTTLYYLKTFAEFKKTNTANCKDREKERGGRARVNKEYVKVLFPAYVVVFLTTDDDDDATKTTTSNPPPTKRNFTFVETSSVSSRCDDDSDDDEKEK